MNWRNAARIDVHNHVRDAEYPGFDKTTGKLNRESAEKLLVQADRLDIDFLCISVPLTTESPRPDEVRLANNVVLEAMAMSERFLGFCFLNPGYARESLDEITRCIVDGGMLGIKIYYQYHVCDPAQTPIMERAAGLGVPVLMHAAKLMDSGSVAQEPRVSNASHFVKAAAMFPDTILIQGHIGGGGDWEWNLRMLEECPNNIYIDTGGTVIDTGIVDRTVAALGVEHVLFATDMKLEDGVGKVLDADLSETDRDRIFAGNMKGILARRTV